MDRRNLLKSVLGSAGVLATSTGLAGSKGLIELCETGLTPKQPEGPFYPEKKPSDRDANLVQVAGHQQEAEGIRVLVEGQIMDQNCAPVQGALVDLWQACHTGKYNHSADPNPAALDPHFQYSAEILTDSAGRFRLRTIVPGEYPASANWIRPPHIHVRVEKLGYQELTTQVYFSQFLELNQEDLILKKLSFEEQARLIMPQSFVVPGSSDNDLGVVAFKYPVQLTIQKLG